LGEEVNQSSLIEAFHRLGSLCRPALVGLIEKYRMSPAKHADETGWRTDGSSGWAWIFATKDVSIFKFADTRSRSIPNKIVVTNRLPVVLVVDRLPAYNKMPVQIQYCYAHLLREVEKLEEEFEGNQEITAFVSQFAPLLSQAMKLRGLEIDDNEY